MLNQINNNISFGKRVTLKENLKIGEKVLKEFKQEFPYLVSHTYTRAKTLQHSEDFRHLYLAYKLQDLASKYKEKIDIMRSFSKPSNFSNYTNYMIKRIKEMQKYKVGNCGDMAEVIQYNFLKENKEAQIIRMDVHDKRTNNFIEPKNHFFTIVGLKQSAIYENPEKWGNQAVIVDPWANIVMKVQDALEYYKEFLKINPQKENISFSLFERIPVNENTVVKFDKITPYEQQVQSLSNRELRSSHKVRKFRLHPSERFEQRLQKDQLSSNSQHLRDTDWSSQQGLK